MSKAKCQLYDIVEPHPKLITSEIWTRVQRRMQGAKWSGEPGQRYGVVYTASQRDIIAGYFAHEGQQTGIQYNDQKQPEEASTESFEHIFFAIFTDTSQVLLQYKRVYGYDSLGLGIMRDRFRKLLAEFLQAEGVIVEHSAIQIEHAGMRYTQGELYAFFMNNAASKLEVKNLQREKIPEPGEPTYKLYNPKEEWNEITWGAVADTLEVGTKHVVIEGESKHAMLNKGPLPKAFARIGDIQEVRAKTEDNQIVIKKRINEEEVTITLPAIPDVVEPLLDRVFNLLDRNERVSSWEHRQEQRRLEKTESSSWSPDTD